MLKSVLLYLESVKQPEPVIQLGVSLARQVDARVRGLTLVDTRDVEGAEDCESAAFLSIAHSRNALTERIHEGARAELSRACLDARLNFDIRRISGNPLHILPRESRFHDLVVASSRSFDKRLPRSAQAALTHADIMQLLQRGVQPLLLLPPKPMTMRRVLLVYDGTEASGRSIRSFLNLGILRDADYRLLAIGRNEDQARVWLAEMAEYCSSHCASLETGCAAGKTRKILLSYASKWEADLIVLGISRMHGLLQRFLGKASLDLVRKLHCSLFVRV